MTKKQRNYLKESIVNTVVATIINHLLTIFLISQFGEDLLANDQLAYLKFTAVFFVVSIIRNYVIRRIFDRMY